MQLTVQLIAGVVGKLMLKLLMTCTQRPRPTANNAIIEASRGVTIAKSPSAISRNSINNPHNASPITLSVFRSPQPT